MNKGISCIHERRIVAFVRFIFSKLILFDLGNPATTYLHFVVYSMFCEIVKYFQKYGYDLLNFFSAELSQLSSLSFNPAWYQIHSTKSFTGWVKS